MSKMTRNFEDACPDMNADMADFKEAIDRAKANGDNTIITITSKSGSHMLYDVKNNTPILYQPYIKAIFTSTLDP